MEGYDDGKLKVVNSEVIFIPPAGGGANPGILPAKGLIIYVNDTPISDTTIINLGDNIKVESKTDLVNEGLIDVKLSRDGLTASLMLKKSKLARYHILDSPEANVLEPEVEQIFYEEKSFNLAAVYEKLSKMGINYGLNNEAIEDAFALMNGEWVTVATGLLPEPGENARLEIYFEKESLALPGEDILESIDYREKGAVFSVEKGSLLARKIPTVPGKVGKTVGGEDIPPSPPKDITLKAGKNTRATGDCLQVFSSVLGRPVLQKKDRQYSIIVEPIFVVEGDVDLNSGHIKFRGDIQVNGKVTESMEVHSDRSVKILDGVNGGLIKAEGSVYVRNNVINSRILAGSRQSFGLNVYPRLVEFESSLVEILKGFQQIKSAPGKENVRFGFILDLLVEKKFRGFVRQLENFSQVLTVNFKDDFSGEIISSIESLRKQLNEFKRLPYQELDSAIRLLQDTGVLKKRLSVNSFLQSDIHVMYCLNSQIEASGSVIVAGQGCFHTDITAHDSIEIKGVTRGGTIKAKKGIKIKEVGSEASIVTNIIVPAKETVFMGKVYENTIVTVGESSHKFNMRRSRVKVLLSSVGSIEITTY